MAIRALGLEYDLRNLEKHLHAFRQVKHHDYVSVQLSSVADVAAEDVHYGSFFS